MSMTQGELSTALGMSRRTLWRWLARLEIRPSHTLGRMACYPPDVADQIRQAQTKALHDRVDLVRAAIGRRHGRTVLATGETVEVGS